jgi:hypothetical protein
MHENTNIFTVLKYEISKFQKTTFEIIKELLGDLSLWEQAVSKIQNSIMDENWKAAEKKRDSWTRTSKNLSIRRVYTVREWYKKLNKSTGVLFLNNLRMGINLLKKISDRIDSIKGLVEAISSTTFIAMNISTQKKINKVWSNYEQSQEKIMRDIQNFQELIKIINLLKSISPPGVSDYLSFNLKVLNDAQNLFKIVEKYAHILDRLSREAQKKSEQSMNNKHSYYSQFQEANAKLKRNAPLY